MVQFFGGTQDSQWLCGVGRGFSDGCHWLVAHGTCSVGKSHLIFWSSSVLLLNVRVLLGSRIVFASGLLVAFSMLFTSSVVCFSSMFIRYQGSKRHAGPTREVWPLHKHSHSTVGLYFNLVDNTMFFFLLLHFRYCCSLQ